MLKVVYKNILEAEEQYIAHQTNVSSSNYSGVAKAIFEAYPWSNNYNTKRFDRLGSIDIFGNGNEQRYVININAQRYPGKADINPFDSTEERVEHFQNCLTEISKIPNITSLALPHKIGCGLAGGDWFTYLSIIKSFAINNQISTVLYKYDPVGL